MRFHISQSLILLILLSCNSESKKNIPLDKEMVFSNKKVDTTSNQKLTIPDTKFYSKTDANYEYNYSYGILTNKFEIKNGVKNGMFYQFRNGNDTIVVGKYQNDTLNGPISFRLKNNKLISGNMLNGQLNGIFKISGEASDITFRDGLPTKDLRMSFKSYKLKGPDFHGVFGYDEDYYIRYFTIDFKHSVILYGIEIIGGKNSVYKDENFGFKDYYGIKYSKIYTKKDHPFSVFFDGEGKKFELDFETLTFSEYGDNITMAYLTHLVNLAPNPNKKLLELNRYGFYARYPNYKFEETQYRLFGDATLVTNKYYWSGNKSWASCIKQLTSSDTSYVFQKEFDRNSQVITLFTLKNEHLPVIYKIDLKEQGILIASIHDKTESMRYGGCLNVSKYGIDKLPEYDQCSISYNLNQIQDLITINETKKLEILSSLEHK